MSGKVSGRSFSRPDHGKLEKPKENQANQTKTFKIVGGVPKKTKIPKIWNI